MVLLGGDAGLRNGRDPRPAVVRRRLPARGQISIQQGAWRGLVNVAKSGQGRVVPMTDAPQSALQRARHLRGERVLYRDDGGGLHKLRNAFCSHLAMRGAPAKAIQELAGHENLMTTLRYMHLSPAARRGAIDLLNVRPDEADAIFGDIVETGPKAVATN